MSITADCARQTGASMSVLFKSQNQAQSAVRLLHITFIAYLLHIIFFIFSRFVAICAIFSKKKKTISRENNIAHATRTSLTSLVILLANRNYYSLWFNYSKSQKYFMKIIEELL